MFWKSSLIRVISQEEKVLNLKCNGFREVNPHYKCCYYLSSRSSEGIWQQNDSMAKEHYGLTEEYREINGWVLPLKLIEYYNAKENSLYSAANHESTITITQIGVFVLYKHLPL